MLNLAEHDRNRAERLSAPAGVKGTCLGVTNAGKGKHFGDQGFFMSIVSTWGDWKSKTIKAPLLDFWVCIWSCALRCGVRSKLDPRGRLLGFL